WRIRRSRTFTCGEGSARGEGSVRGEGARTTLSALRRRAPGPGEGVYEVHQDAKSVLVHRSFSGPGRLGDREGVDLDADGEGHLVVGADALEGEVAIVELGARRAGGVEGSLHGDVLRAGRQPLGAAQHTDLVDLRSRLE